MNAAVAVFRGTWAQAAEDLRTLAWLHAAERSSALWLALAEAGLPNGLVLLPVGDPSLAAMTQALTELAVCRRQDAQACDDELAADYAAIYLTHALRASPCESVWRDEDHLMRQGPTFAVREVYRHHGLAVRDPNGIPDDHLSHELGFVAELLARGECAAAGAFLDEHLLAWLPSFAARVAERAATPVYAALAVLTAQACIALRQALSASLPVPNGPANAANAADAAPPSADGGIGRAAGRPGSVGS